MKNRIRYKIKNIFKFTPKKLITFCIVIGLIAYFAISFYYDYRCLDYDYEKIVTEDTAYEVKDILLKQRIDDIPMMIYTAKDTDGEICFCYYIFLGGKQSMTYFSFNPIKEIEIEYEPWYYDNMNKHRVVYGFCEPSKAKNITVNGKHVESKPIKHSCEEYELDVYFWYIVLDEKSDFKVRNSNCDGDFVGREYIKLDDNVS